MKNKFFVGVFILFLLVSCNIGLLNASHPKLPEKNGEVGVSETTAFEEDKPVRNLRASEAESAVEIQINWTAFAKASYYTIERCCVNSTTKTLTGSEQWTELPSQTQGTSFTDKSALEKGTFYAYRVRAYSREEKAFSQYSNPAFGSILSTPASIEVEKGKQENAINISFSQVPGASGYDIYKSLEKTDKSEFEKVNQTLILQSKSPVIYYSYTPKEDEKGKVIYFIIRSVSSSGKAFSDMSNMYQGYTKVRGAAEKPKNFIASKGASNDAITISFSADMGYLDGDDEVKYTLFRTSKGSAEVEKAQLFPSINADENGIIRYTDNENLNENTPYTYSLVAENSFGKSEASIDVGYIFSTPKSALLTPVTSADNFGYKLSIDAPIGTDENPQWFYEITQSYENGTSSVDEVSVTSDVFYPCVKDPIADAEGYANEIRSVSVKLKSTELYSKNSATCSVPSIPEKAASISASSNFYKDAFVQKVNSDGVYPVTVSFQSQSLFSYAKVRRNDGAIVDLSYPQTEYEDSAINLAKKYSYTVELFDALGRSFGQSIQSQEGYGAIEANKFVDMFEQHCLKPWVSSSHPEYRDNSQYNSIYNYVRQAGTGSLGSATVNAKYKHSSSSYMYYNAKVNGIGGYVTFRYQDFGECDYMWISGSAEYSMDVNASGTGSVVNYTTFNISGLFPSQVDFSSLSVKNQAFSGVYNITLNYNGTKKTVKIAPKN